jgi:hypothetical protein
LMIHHDSLQVLLAHQALLPLKHQLLVPSFSLLHLAYLPLLTISRKHSLQLLSPLLLAHQELL